MKTLLIVCGAGHATSTIAVAKVQEWLNSNGYTLLTGLGVEQLYKDLKERLGL